MTMSWPTSSSHSLFRGALTAILLLSFAATAARTDDSVDRDKEAALRAAFLYRLAFFVQWPETDPAHHQALRFCVIGPATSRIGKLLTEQAGSRAVKDRAIEVGILNDSDPLTGCHIAYAEQAVKSAVPDDTLLVVDSPQRLSKQGVLALVRQTQPGGEIRLGFVGRHDRLSGAPYQLSAKLLQLVKFDQSSERS